MTQAPFTYTLSTSEPRLDQFLSRQTGETRSFIKRQIETGRVQLNGTVVERGAVRLQAGDQVEGSFEDLPKRSLEPIAGKLTILHEDADILVLNKQQDLVVHPAAGHQGETLVHYLLYHFQSDRGFADLAKEVAERPGIVHRLDRGTSGVMVIAKNRHSLESLSAQFKDRSVEKEYEALVWGRLEGKGCYRSEIGRDRTDRKKMSSRTKEGRDAITYWQSAFAANDISHILLFPKTGRTHQLRVHLAENGHSIIGDPIYGTRGSKRRLGLESWYQELIAPFEFPFLHARRLKITHPSSKAEMEWVAERPDSFTNLLQKAHSYQNVDPRIPS